MALLTRRARRLRLERAARYVLVANAGRPVIGCGELAAALHDLEPWWRAWIAPRRLVVPEELPPASVPGSFLPIA